MDHELDAEFIRTVAIVNGPRAEEFFRDFDPAQFYPIRELGSER